MYRFGHYFILVFSVLCFNFVHTIKDKKCGELFLTVNAVHNLLEFNWDFTRNCAVTPDTLTLYYENSELTAPKIHLQSISVREKPKGYYLSSTAFGRPEFPGQWNMHEQNPKMGNHCYPFWLESTQEGALIDTVCIKIEPTWMENFGKLKIGQMMIPGTHDSGAYTEKNSNLVNRYTYTQETNLWEQLVSGIRYFDIRVGLYPIMRPSLWINHGLVPCSKMEEQFNRIANFLRKAPHEVVILHFHSFEMPLDFKDEDHQEVLKLIQKVFSEFILPRENFQIGEGPTLEDIWATNKRLIVSYNDKNQVANHNWLWNPVPHKWGNKQDATDLFYYLEKQRSNHNHPQTPFCVLISVLTADADYIVTNVNKSLRHMADEVNPGLSSWIPEGNWEADINIIATDFFMGNDVIDIAIQANSKKLIS